MTNSDFIRILITFGTGAGVVLIGTWVGHSLSGQRWKAELRNAEVSHWRDFADKWFNFAMEFAHIATPIVLAERRDALQQQLERDWIHLNQIKNLQADLAASNRRAPEPLTNHVRLFIDRMHRSATAIPFEIELAKFAIVHFRAALDDYVRRGRTKALRLIEGESPSDYDRVKGVFRFAPSTHDQLTPR